MQLGLQLILIRRKINGSEIEKLPTAHASPSQTLAQVCE